MAINGKINLMKYVGARKVSIGGHKGIFIPVELNPTIFVGEKGAYASVRVVEHESTFDDVTYSHFIAASLSKDIREELEAKYGKDEVKKMTPILGNMSTYTGGSTQTNFEETSEDADDLPSGDLPKGIEPLPF